LLGLPITKHAGGEGKELEAAQKIPQNDELIAQWVRAKKDIDADPTS